MAVRKRRRSIPALRVIGLGVVCALCVRALSASGVEQHITRALMRAAESPGFVRYAITSETCGAELSLPRSWTGVLVHELPLGIPAKNLSEERAAREAEFLSSLKAWSYTPPKKSDPRALPIKEISINPKSSKGYVNLGKIYLKNDSSREIDLNAYLKAKLPFTLKGDGPHVLILHTHGSESYFPGGKFTYTPDDVERTSDKRYNVIRVGDEIEKILREEGISVVHDRNIYDSPSYNGSYTRALKAISTQLQKTPSVKVVLDIHRDAMTSADGVKYKTHAEVNGEAAAQLMLVMSTGESGLAHPNWQENLKLAVKLQSQIANKYPGLMRPINLRKERFNMHATTGSMLVEVGTSANSMEEALNAVRPFSRELAALLKTVKK